MKYKIEDVELRSEEVQEILDKVPHWLIRRGNLVILSALTMILAFSWLIKYPDLIISEAMITTSIPPQKEYAKVTGKIDALLVSSNDHVQAGQPLAIIENTADYLDVFHLSSLLDTIPLSNTSFSFPLEVIPPLDLGTDIESAFAVFENSYLRYRINKDLQPFSNEANTNNYTLMELDRRLKNLNYQKELSLTELNYRKKELERNQTLYEQKVISEQNYESSKLSYIQAERNFENMSISISQLQESISSARKNAQTIEFNRTEQELILFRKVIQSFNQLKEQIAEWELRYVLKAEQQGQVSFLDHWHKNQTVQQGDLVFTVVPSENTSYIARLKTPTRNSGKIERGQKVNIKLDNYPEEEFGTLEGRIASVSLIPNEEGFYWVNVALPSNLTTSFGLALDFRQEMEGTAEIITKDLRLLERFFNKVKVSMR